MDAKASLPRIELSVREGNKVGVTRTPTSFVNGTMVVGLESPEAFYRVVDEALRQAAAKRAERRSPKVTASHSQAANP
jgi:predicted DsbA family dithiol-disulfide isomerase